MSAGLFALHLAERGWDVAITYHTSGDAASSLAEKVESLGRQCLLIKADLTDPEAATTRVAEAVGKRFGRLDLLMHNASLYEPSGPVRRDGRADATAVRASRRVAVAADAEAHPAAEIAANGTVIAMSDVNVDRPRPSYAAYTMSKAALANLVPKPRPRAWPRT